MVDVTPEGIDEFMKKSVAWNPRPLRRQTRPEEYPLSNLPPLIANAVREVQDYVHAPMAMVAACALSVVSSAVQSRFDIRRDAVLNGPSSLYFLTVAESGERKTAIDKLFMTPLREWEARQARAAREAKKRFDADYEAWEEKGRKLTAQIEQGMYAELLGGPLDPRPQHNARRPQEPRTARMLRGDDTPEALLIALQEYPVAAVISAEAGMIFGSHGMSSDTVQRNLATFNIMWDGGPVRQDRVSRERIHIENIRATLGLQVQPAVLQHFIQRTGGLARGIGYFARFLFSQPESTQGSRYYTEPATDMPALREFCARVTALLDQPAEFDELDRLAPLMVDFCPEAQRIWIGFHNEVEEQLGGDDYFSTIKDVASKAAENAARLACCCHTFTADEPGPISMLSMVNACAVMRWYLDEALRFGQATDATEEVRNAELLEEWLVRQMRRDRELEKSGITVNTVRQKGPNSLRVRPKLDSAIELLEDHGRIRVTQAHGTKRRYITVAPQVLEGRS